MGWLKVLAGLFRPEPTDTGIYYQHVREMLEVARSMFDQVTEPLLHRENSVALTREQIRAMDRKVNHLEREIRRALLTAAAVNPAQAATQRLTLMGLAKDAERCGDFAKHIFDVFEDAGPLEPDAYHEFLVEQRAFILRLFDEVWRVFDESDAGAAKSLLEEARSYSKRDSRIVHDLLRGAECQQPVAVALLSRFFKRIQRHLVNIAVAVVSPEDQLGPLDDLDERGPAARAGAPRQE